MMFITPIPPTSSEIAATSPSSVVKTLLVELEASQQRALVEHAEARFGGVLDLVAFLEDLRDLAFGGVRAPIRTFASTVIESIGP